MYERDQQAKSRNRKRDYMSIEEVKPPVVVAEYMEEIIPAHWTTDKEMDEARRLLRNADPNFKNTKMGKQEMLKFDDEI